MHTPLSPPPLPLSSPLSPPSFPPPVCVHMCVYAGNPRTSTTRITRQLYIATTATTKNDQLPPRIIVIIVVALSLPCRRLVVAHHTEETLSDFKKPTHRRRQSVSPSATTPSRVSAPRQTSERRTENSRASLTFPPSSQSGINWFSAAQTAKVINTTWNRCHHRHREKEELRAFY